MWQHRMFKNKSGRDRRGREFRMKKSTGITGKKAAGVVAAVITAALILGGTLLGKENTLYAKADGRPVSISSCTISGSDVVCQLSAGSVPSSDDGKYYIYADEVYQDGTTGKVVATVNAGASVTASFPLSYNSADSNLSR